MKYLFLIPMSFAVLTTFIVWVGAHYDSWFAYFASVCMGILTLFCNPEITTTKKGQDDE